MLKRELFRAALKANRGYDIADGQLLLASLVATHGSHGSWSAIFTSVKEPVLPVPPFHHLCSKLEGAVGVGLETQPLAATKQGSSSRQRPERGPDMLKYSGYGDDAGGFIAECASDLQDGGDEQRARVLRTRKKTHNLITQGRW